MIIIEEEDRRSIARAGGDIAPKSRPREIVDTREKERGKTSVF